MDGSEITWVENGNVPLSVANNDTKCVVPVVIATEVTPKNILLWKFIIIL